MRVSDERKEYLVYGYHRCSPAASVVQLRGVACLAKYPEIISAVIFLRIQRMLSGTWKFCFRAAVSCAGARGTLLLSLPRLLDPMCLASSFNEQRTI